MTSPSRLSNFGPNWFASVMGTGIVANALAGLPHRPGWAIHVATAIWILAALVLVVTSAATALHWRRYRETARSHINNPAMSPFYGAPAMAFLTVGAGALLTGQGLLGLHVVVAIDWVLWLIGTILGLITAALLPYLQFTSHDLDPSKTFASWLMPVVPPMVSASTGALLVAHTPAGELRTDMFFACFAMFGITALASIFVISLLWSRLAYDKVGPNRMVPTLWIVLGPIGQSITAAHLLSMNAHLVVDQQTASVLETIGLTYGGILFGFGLLWFSIASAITIKTANDGLPFSLTWWSFTFPVGTMVTGTSGLAAATGSEAISWIAVALFLFLLCAWATVAIRTLKQTQTGELFAPA